jgi:hypothetical protein
MNRIVNIIALALVASLGFVAAPASANYGTQVCWADPNDPQLVHHPLAIETDRDDDGLTGMIVRPLPQNANGCASYNGTPLQDWEELYVDPTPPLPAGDSSDVAYWRAAYESADAQAMKWMQDYYSLGLLVDASNARGDRLAARVAQQRETIKRLRAKLNR